MAFVISRHARQQIVARGIREETILGILENPLQVIYTDAKNIYQGIIEEDEKQYLIRIFVNPFKEPKVVITAYKTSKSASIMKVVYDKETNVLYIHFKDVAIEESDEDKHGEMIIDYAADGSVVGIEVLNASEKLAMPLAFD